MYPTQSKSICVVCLAVFASLAGGQTRSAIPPSEKNFFIGTPAGWVHPKTPWGDPDLQGIWPLNYVGSTPLQRCNAFGRGGAAAPPCDPHKEFLTEEEFKTIQANAAKTPDRYTKDFTAAVEQGEVGRAFLAGVVDPTTPQRQTSLIFDPPDGRLPEMTPEGKRLSAAMKSSWGLPGEKLVFDSYHDFDLWDRCITRGMPVSMFPFRYDNGVQIIQSPGQVVILLEMIHDARIVPLNDNTPVPPEVKQWMGVSRGHWEGNTLVVETTNFRDGASQTNTAVIASPPGNRFPTSEQMKVTERFTRINDQFLIYEIKTEDPVVLTHSWTARFPLKRDPDYKLLEYSCQEDNQVVPDWISVSRAERAGNGAAKVEAPRR
ncbi:MAG TPA: hypothetical protein VLY24_00580 [Bryobacteraceae bacterium]|nr:hypothetical protein [Bryobacteraceae bacterium]